MNEPAVSLDVELAVATDPRLKRHRVHDPRSRSFALPPVALPTQPVMHKRSIPIFDQGDLGCCTAAAELGMLSTGPLDLGRPFTMSDVRDFYSDETKIDDWRIPGHWPPNDTGSAGIYASKLAKRRGWILDYRHAFSLTTCLGWLGHQPISIGIPWLETMFDPRPDGLLVVDRRAPVAGGHQVCLDAIDPVRSLVRLANSWGTAWGPLGGWAWLTYANLGWLLSRGGDAVTATVLAK